MTFLKSINDALEVGRCLIRKWWRPLTTVAMAGSVWVNGIFLPLTTKTPADMTALSLLVTAVVAAFAVRSYEKAKGLE